MLTKSYTNLQYIIYRDALRGYWSLVLWGIWVFENGSNLFGMITKCTTDQIIKKNSKFLCFFDFFLSIFFKMKFKNNVCFNLTTKTWKFHLDVSQFSDQCFCGFLLIILSKKSKHIFFLKLFHVTFKNLYFEYGVEI